MTDEFSQYIEFLGSKFAIIIQSSFEIKRFIYF